jgi:diacylglycerol kinase family enzyme
MQQISSTSPARSAIIVSLRAGQVRSNPEKRVALREICKGRGRLYELDSEVMLGQACRELYALRPWRVVIVGGDGSLMRILSELYRAYGGSPLPRITLVPAGTVNLAAKQWEIRGKPEVLLERALEKLATQVVSRPSLKVQIDGQPYVAFTVGTGLVSHFFEAYEEHEKRGARVASEIFFRTFFGAFLGSPYARRILAPVNTTLTLGKREFGEQGLTLLVSSVFRDVGLGLKPTYRASTVPGQLHLVASTLPARRLGPLALRVLQGKPLHQEPKFPEVIDCLTEQFGLSLAETTKIVLDGDTIRARHITVQPGPMLSVERY